MAEWTTAFNDLPDSSFLYIEPGGEKDEDGKTTPRSLRHFPYKDAAGKVDLPHLRNALSRIPQSNVTADVKKRLQTRAQGILEKQTGRALPTASGDLARLGSYGFEIRAEGGELGGPVLSGTLATFNSWAEIRSAREGHFMESISPSAFDKTVSERKDTLQVLFDHGDDPSIGRKPLGRVLEFDNDGEQLRYEVELLDADYVRGLLPGLEKGLYGMSFNFRPVRSKKTSWPERSQHNPGGIPEVVLQEVEMREFGPTPFPVYRGTSAGLRSISDELRHPTIPLPELLELLRGDAFADSLDDLPEESVQAAPPTDQVRRGSSHLYGESRKEGPRWRIP